MKFGEIIQFIRSTCRKLKELCLCFFSKRPPIVEENPENSEEQNPQNSPPEEKAKTKDKSSKVDKEPDSNSPSPAQTQPSEKTETAPPPKRLSNPCKKHPTIQKVPAPQRMRFQKLKLNLIHQKKRCLRILRRLRLHRKSQNRNLAAIQGLIPWKPQENGAKTNQSQQPKTATVR